MVIADTSIWIEFLRNRDPFCSQLSSLIENRQVLALECIFGELLQGAANKKEISVIKEFWENLPKTLDRYVMIKAGEFSAQNKLASKGIGLIDTVLIVTSRISGAGIWTLDKKLARVLSPSQTYTP